MRININGMDVDTDEFFRQQQIDLSDIYNKYREAFKCNNALITDVSPNGAVVYCSLDRTIVPNSGVCLQCKAYKDTVDFINKEEND